MRRGEGRGQDEQRRGEGDRMRRGEGRGQDEERRGEGTG